MQLLNCGALVLNSIASGITAGIQARAQASSIKYKYESAALTADYQAKVARANANIAASDLVSNQLAVERNAAIQGMQAAKTMAGTRASMASSGVYLNSASKYEVQASQRFSQAVNLGALQENQANQLAADKNKIASYLGQSILQEAAAKTNRSLAGSINPSGIGVSTAFSTLFSGLNKLATANAFSEIDVPNVDLGIGINKSPDYGVDVEHDPNAFSTKLAKDYNYFGEMGSNLTKVDYDYFDAWMF